MPARWFWTATRGGALALQQPQVGALQPGLEADMVLHSLPEWVEDPQDVLNTLLFHQDAPPVLRTWVRGRTVSQR